jgi:hypothetical protein
MVEVDLIKDDDAVEKTWFNHRIFLRVWQNPDNPDQCWVAIDAGGAMADIRLVANPAWQIVARINRLYGVL